MRHIHFCNSRQETVIQTIRPQAFSLLFAVMGEGTRMELVLQQSGRIPGKLAECRHGRAFRTFHRLIGVLIQEL